MSTFIVFPFTLQKIENEHPFVYTTQGAVRLTSHAMHAALSALKTHEKFITEDTLDSLLSHHEIDPKAGQAFLERVRIIGLIRPSNAIALYTSDPSMGETLQDHIQTNDAVRVFLTEDPLSLTEPTLLVALQSAYCPSFAQHITDICERNRHLLLAHGYFVYRHFVSDGLFSAAMGLPNHFTMMEHLTCLERSAHFRPSSWAELFCSSPTQKFSIPTLPMTTLEKNAGLHMFYNRLRTFMTYGASPFYGSDISTIWELNLDTGVVEKHRSVYSSLASSYVHHKAAESCVPETTA